jgi:folate-binding protein YgfZ
MKSIRFITCGLNHALPLGQHNRQCHMAAMSNPVFHLADRAVIRICGSDTRDFLQRVITNDLKLCASGTLQAGALLTPQGKIICDFLIHGKDDGVVLDIREEAADALVKRLSLYRLRANADITLDSSAFVVAGTGLPDPRSSELPLRAIADEKPEADGTTRQAGLEIESGVAAFGRDYGEAEVFPTDVNLDLYGGIAWKKGCFIGQEVLSRMKRRGTIRKRTVAVAANSAEPAMGDVITAGDVPLGNITSSAGRHALAILRLDRLDAASEAPTLNGEAVTISPPPISPD